MTAKYKKREELIDENERLQKKLDELERLLQATDQKTKEIASIFIKQPLAHSEQNQPTNNIIL